MEENGSLKIVALSWGCCIRVIKESLELMKRKHKVHFMQYQIRHPSFNDVIPTSTMYLSPDTLAPKFEGMERQMGKQDIVHVHNEPSWMVSCIRKFFPDKKIILDIHDLQYIRGEKNEWGTDEEAAIKDADGFIFPSITYQEKMKEFIGGKPSTVVYSMCNAEVMPRMFYPKVEGLCYQGGITWDNTGADYCDYRELAKLLTNNQVPFYLYGANTLYHNVYYQLGAICLQMFDYSPLLQQMTRQKWGFVGGQKIDNPQWNSAVPNKLFEYLASGVIPIVYGAKEAGEYVKDNDIGVVCDSLEDVIETVRNPLLYQIYYEKVMQKREQLTMETQVDKILNLYKQVMG
jgi:hypothetical protein